MTRATASEKPMNTQEIDNAIADPRTYGDEAKIHELLGGLRKNDPLHWTQPEGFRPYWAVTKYTDILEIEKLNDKFHNEPRSTLMDIKTEHDLASMWGGPDPKTGRVSPFRTLIDMDNPDHRAYRGLTQAWFMPANLKKLEARTNELAKRYVDLMMERGPQCDFAREIAVYYPLHVIMSILGVPESDEPLMLKLTQELFGGSDPDMKRKEDASTNTSTIMDFFVYFNKMSAERRANPGDDLASVIANGKVNGCPLADLEMASYYIIVATAGHDTTSATIAGGLRALAENPDQLAKLKANPDLLGSAVDEMFRWSTPVQHFMRTAMDDHELRGKTIKKGQALQLLYLSGNRDEEAFADPFKFKVDRENNRHVAFGYGAHVCIGQHLAKMEIKAFFKELLGRLLSLELTGEPRRIQSTFVSGLKALPVRYAISA
jgi:cytochrome P450